MTLAVIMAGLALFISGVTCMCLLFVLGRRDFHYASKGELDSRDVRLDDLGRQQSLLWRYVEAIDEQTGGLGHQVLGRAVQLEDAET